MTYWDNPYKLIEPNGARPHPIIGYREWAWDPERGRLTGPYHRRIPWKPGMTIASCSLFGHDAPDPNCSCGV